MNNPQELIECAIDLSDAENYAEAIEVLTRAISFQPDNAQAYFERGMALMNLNKDADAAGDFDRALEIDQKFPGAREWRARAAQSLGDHKRAAEERLLALREKPDGPYQGMGVSPQNWADCAGAFTKAGEHQKARELLEEYFEKYASNVKSYARHETAPMRVFSKLLIDVGDFVRASEVARNAYTSKHRVPADILAYAIALESVGQFESALNACEEMLRFNDRMPGAQELHKRLCSRHET